MARQSVPTLSRREREIMNIVYALGRATAAEVRGRMADPPSYSAVRATLRVLEDKGQLRHKQDGPRYVYLPTVARDRARRSALREMLQTFFDGSTQQAVTALLDLEASNLSPADFDRMLKSIEKARKEGR